MVTRPVEVPADVVVLTALDLEYQAVRVHLTGLRTYVDLNGTRYETGESRGGRCRIALALTGPGNLAAAALTGRAVARFRPRALLLVGVAGGLADDVALGDVVVATRVHAYHGGRAEAGVFRPRPKSWPLSHGLEQDARDVARGGSWVHWLPVDDRPAGEAAPAVHFKPLVSGEVVLDARDGLTAELIAQHYSDAVAIDMESAGVAEAAHHNDFHQAITVRAISDRADGNKRDSDATGWQRRAVTRAAAFAIALSERIADGWGSTRPAGTSPYRGLAAFREDDAELFFGRAEMTDELARSVSARRFVAVVGRSGSGKSSLVHAGLVPRMRRRGWAVAAFRPLPGVPAAVALAGGLLPLLRPGLGRTEALSHRAALADALAGGRLAEVAADVLAATGARGLLVCVDQFEELVVWSEEGAGELARLLARLSAGPVAAHVVLTATTETLDVAVHRLGLGDVATNSVFLLTPMSTAQLRGAIEGPVRSTGVFFEPGLVARILEAAHDAPAALTSTQFALTRLWEEQDHGRMTHHAYDAFGGVGGALASYAERVWAEELDEDQRAGARRLLVQLVRPDGDGDGTVRRTARGSELAPELVPLARHLAAARLTVIGTDATGEVTIDLAHAALATQWQRLRGWLGEEREFRSWQEDLRESIRRAEQLRGTRLTAAVRWLRAHGSGVSGPERDFIFASRRRHRRRTGAWRGLLLIVVVLLVATSTFAVVLGRRGDELADQLRRNAARVLAADARERQSTDPDTAALLSVAAFRAGQDPEVLTHLAGEYQRYRSTDRVHDLGVGQIQEIVVSADGDTVAAAGIHGAAILRTDRGSAAVTRHGRHLRRIALSRDGGLLAAATDEGRVELRRADGAVTVLRRGGPESNRPSALRFDDRGERLLAALPHGGLRVWDLVRGTEVRVPAGAAEHAALASDAVWFGPGGTSVVVATRSELVLWPLDGQAPTRVTPVTTPGAVTVTGDGRTGITCADDTLLYWDLATAEERDRRPIPGLPCPATTDAAVSHSGQVMVVMSVREGDDHPRDATLVLDLTTDGPARAVAATPGPSASPVPPRLAADETGTHLITAVGTSVAVVDLARSEFAPFNGVAVVNPLFSQDLRYAATTTQWTRQNLYLWDAGTGAELARAENPDRLTPVGFSGGGAHLLALAPELDHVVVFQVPSLRVVARTELPAELARNRERFTGRFTPFCVAALPAPEALAIFHAGFVIRLDLASGALSHPPLRLWRTDAELEGLADTVTCRGRPDRAQVAFDVGASIEVWDVDGGERATTLPVDDVGDISGMRFSPDGRTLAVTGFDGSMQLWDVERRRPLGEPRQVVSAHVGVGVTGFPSENRMVIRGGDVLRVWDLDRNAVIADVDATASEASVIAADGGTLAHWGVAGLTRIPLEPRRWADHLCAVIGRDLTATERRGLPPGGPTGRIC